jgi:hypothetical protein
VESGLLVFGLSVGNAVCRFLALGLSISIFETGFLVGGLSVGIVESLILVVVPLAGIVVAGFSVFFLQVANDLADFSNG